MSDESAVYSAAPTPPRTPYVHVMTGLPGSGKTTLARDLLAQAGGRMRRVCLDDLRAMADPVDAAGRPLWSAAHEQATVAMQDACIREAVLAGYDVLVDNTHLTPRATEHLKAAIGRCGWFVVHSLLHVPIDECIARDAERPRPVGEDVIHRLADGHVIARGGGWELNEEWLNSAFDAARGGALWARNHAAVEEGPTS